MAIYTFGSNISYQMSNLDIINTSKPQKLDFFDNHQIKLIECGYLHTFIYTNEGLFSYGCNDDGQLGREGNEEEIEHVNLPQVYTSLFMSQNSIKRNKKGILWQKNPVIKKIQAGGSFSAVLTSKNQLFICGTFRDSHGVFGLSPDIRSTPILTPLMSKVKDISAGRDFLIIQTTNNCVYALGNNDFEQISHFKMRNKQSLTPHLIASKIESIGAGAYHYFCVRSNKQVIKRGLNNYNQLGMPDELVDDEIKLMAKKLNVEVAGESKLINNTIELQTEQSTQLPIYAEPMLGITNIHPINEVQVISNSSSIPTQTNIQSQEINLQNENIEINKETGLKGGRESVDQSGCCKLIGGTYSSFLVHNKTLYSVGSNKDGQLGLGNKSDQSPFSYCFAPVDEISCKMDFCLFSSNNDLFSFGTSNNGENGAESDLLVPTKLGFSNVQQFSCGADFSVVDGDLI